MCDTSGAAASCDCMVFTEADTACAEGASVWDNSVLNKNKHLK